MRNPEAVLFDLDGTLIDRRASIARYSALFCAEFSEIVGNRSRQAVDQLLITADGHGYRASQRAVDIAVGLESPDSRDSIERHWQANFPQCAAAAAGAFKVLDELRASRHLIGLVTNGSVRAQRAKLSVLGLEDSFDAISISEECDCKKPDPRIFTDTLAGLGVEPGCAWFVGDHPINDVWGAERVGMRGFLVPGVAWPDNVTPCGTDLDSLIDLLAYLHAAAD